MYLGVAARQSFSGKGSNLSALGYGVMVWLGLHAFVRAYEEPTWRRRFVEHYEQFSRNVPWWLPGLKARNGKATSGNQARVPGGNDFSIVPGNIVQLRAGLVHICW
jgi:hypothetical protein